MRRAPLLALVLLLLAPTAAAVEAEVVLRAAEAGGVWNGMSAVRWDEPVDRVVLWVPPGARVHDVTAGEGARVVWEVAAPDAVAVRPPEGADEVRVAYDFTPSEHRLAVLRAPMPYDALLVRVAPGPGEEVRAEGLDFAPAGDAPGVAARVAPAPEGATFVVRVVDESRLGEAGLLLAVAGLSALLLLLVVLWHAVRPPLGGAEPARFVDHLRELQARLVPAAVGFFALNVVFFAVGLERHARWLVVPTLDPREGLSARAFDAFAERLVPAGVDLVALRPVEAVLAQVQVTLLMAFVAVLPVLVYETAAFLGPALLPRERRVARGAAPVVLGLFAAGALFGLLVMAPLLIRTLYAYAPALGARPLLAVSDLVSFALLLLLAFGLAFELPVLMYVLPRLGVVQAGTFRRHLRHAILVIVVAAGVLTPDPSVVSQLLVAVPVTALYLLGLAAAAAGERRRARGEAALNAA